MKKEKGGKSPERDYRKEMIEAEYYNYNRIPGYNHHTGWVDKRYPRSRDERVTEPLDVKLIIFDEWWKIKKTGGITCHIEKRQN